MPGIVLHSKEYQIKKKKGKASACSFETCNTMGKTNINPKSHKYFHK